MDVLSAKEMSTPALPELRRLRLLTKVLLVLILLLTVGLLYCLYTVTQLQNQYREVTELRTLIQDLRTRITQLNETLQDLRIAVVSGHPVTVGELLKLRKVLEQICTELKRLERVLLGRAYGKHTIFYSFPSPPVKDFTSRVTAGVEDPWSALALLSRAVYERVHYVDDPPLAPLLYTEKWVEVLGTRIPLVRFTMVRTYSVFRTPSEVLTLGIGDCEDYASLYLACATYYLSSRKLRSIVAEVGFYGFDKELRRIVPHSLVIGVLDTGTGPQWFLTDPSWKGYFAKGTTLLDCFRKYLSERGIEVEEVEYIMLINYTLVERMRLEEVQTLLLKYLYSSPPSASR